MWTLRSWLTYVPVVLQIFKTVTNTWVCEEFAGSESEQATGKEDE